MRWCYEIGRSFRYNLVSGQLINHLSHPVFFAKFPQKSTWQSWPQLLTSHSCWHSSYSWRFFQIAGQKSVPIWCWNFPWSKKTSDKPWGFPSSGASWVLPIHFAFKHFWFFCAQSALVQKFFTTHDIEIHQLDPNLMIFTKLETGQTETEMTNRAVSDWIYWLQACTITPFFYRFDILSQWPYRKHRASDCTSWRRVDHSTNVLKTTGGQKNNFQFGEMILEHDMAKKYPKASQRTAFWNTKKLVGKDFGISFAMKYIQQLYHNPWRISPVRRTWHMTKRSTQTRVRALLLTYWRVAIQCLMIHIYMKTTRWDIGSKFVPLGTNIPYPTYGKKESHLSNHLGTGYMFPIQASYP